jgi:ribosomal protein S18 acetylase RimI-like enzyme
MNFLKMLSGRRRAGAYRFRPVRADDADRFQAFVTRLSPAARRLRFHGAVKACSPALLKALTQPDPAHHQAWVAVRQGAGEELIVGEGRFVACEGRFEAELAIAVADDHCGQGIGDRLLRTVLAGAARADVPVLFADVLEGNSRMFALLQRHGFEAGYSTHIAAGLVRWRRRVQPFGTGPLRWRCHGRAGPGQDGAKVGGVLAGASFARLQPPEPPESTP